MRGKFSERFHLVHLSILSLLLSVHFTVASAVILLSTLIPKGALAFNPKALGSIGGREKSHPPSVEDSEDEKDFKKAETRDISELENARS